MILIMFLFWNCAISSPFQWKDSIDRNKDIDRKVYVGITEVVLGDDSKKNDLFWDYVYKLRKEIHSNNGFLGISIRRQLFQRKAWTMTVWESEEDMDNFVYSGTHKKAMKDAFDAMVSTRFARVELTFKEIPISWEKAEKFLDERENKKRKTN
ncbi:MAG: DUF3291 domain-containing protein [Leptospiraceae bacterium]|nr:DUF3291 domain-containing protein [Leptospiraceae bacterium]